MKSFQKNRKGVVVTILTIICFIFVIGLLSFFLSLTVQAVSEPTTTLANSFHNSSWTFYDALNGAETFMANFWIYLIVIAMFGLALWVYFDSQLRGERM